MIIINFFGLPGQGYALIYFDGTYRLRREGNARSRLKGQCSAAWRIRIINFEISSTEVRFIRPYAIIATRQEKGIFEATCAESIGKRICRDFDLKADRILWIEHIEDNPQRMYTANFLRKQYPGPEIYYSISWRPANTYELEAIGRFIPEAKNVT